MPRAVCKTLLAALVPLLLAVLVVGSAAAATATTLQWVSTVSSVGINQEFSLSGKLVDSGGNPISGATVILQKSTDGLAWSQVASGTTDENGTVVFESLSETSNGTYYYRLYFAGGTIGENTYDPCTSTPITVEVAKLALDLSLGVDKIAPNLGEIITFTVFAMHDGSPVSGITVALEKSTDGSNWTPVASASTDSNGKATFVVVAADAGSFQYRASFDGDNTYAEATSNVLTVNVVNPSGGQQTPQPSASASESPIDYLRENPVVALLILVVVVLAAIIIAKKH